MAKDKCCEKLPAESFSFIKKVESALRTHEMLLPGCRVVVGLSGGADSVSLLLALHELRERKVFDFSLAACHLNHGIRGSDADDDEAFCEALCREKGIPFFSRRVDIPSLSKEAGAGTEETARRIRYAYFDELCEKESFDRIATAHTMTDNLETLVFNLCRGCTIDGLCAIPPVRMSERSGAVIIRPLCGVERREVEAFLAGRGQSFRTDATNNDEDYTRNYIRKEILPRLCAVNPAVPSHAARLCDALREDAFYLESAADEYLTDGEKSSGTIALNKIRECDKALLPRVLRLLCRGAFGEAYYLAGNRIGALMNALRDFDGTEKHLSLPGEREAILSRDGFCFCDKEKTAVEGSSYHIPLSEGQTILNADFAIFLSRGEVFTEPTPKVIRNGDIVYKLYKNEAVLSAIIKGTLFARSRENGDVIIYGGHTRSVKKLMNEEAIPQELRRTLPLICDERGVLMVPGVGRVRELPSERKGGGDVTMIAVYSAHPFFTESHENKE